MKISGYRCNTDFIRDNMGAIPLPAAKKKMFAKDFTFSGRRKNPAAPVVKTLSPTLARSTSFLERKPLSIRFTAMDKGSFKTGEEMIE